MFWVFFLKLCSKLRYLTLVLQYLGLLFEKRGTNLAVSDRNHASPILKNGVIKYRRARNASTDIDIRKLEEYIRLRD